ncbi:hypothetical protein PTKIN_Ptkin05aG0085200 [Pterospermum kingtungense]
MCATASALVRSARSSTDDFKQANMIPERNASVPNHTWIAPPFGFCKLNVDAAKSSLRFSQFCKLSFEHFGLEIVHHYGLLVQLVESDFLGAINEIHRGTSSFLPWLNLIMDIDLFAAYCGVHKFSHVTRDANELAHKIAKSHCLQGTLSVWQFALPPALYN